MEKEVKAVVFDIGDVLCLGKQHSSKISLKCKGPHEEVTNKLRFSIDQYIDSISPIHNKSISGEISFKETVESLSRNFGKKKSEINEIYSNAYKKQFTKNTRLLNKVKQLKKQGYKTAILSDQWHMSKGALMPKSYYKYFDEVLVSCDEGMRKPEEKFFKLSLKKLNVKPSEALFIDDQKWNTRAAKRLGIQTILFENNEQLFKNPKWKKLFEEK
ncbi:MAG: HAD family hydrolase [Candidatus Pacearchaeota archaeon]